MIGVEGQYQYSFSIGSLKDFILEGDLEFFKLVEEVGNKLPTWEISFQYQGDDAIGSFNEGNIFKVSFGRHGGSGSTTAELFVVESQVTRIGDTAYRIYACGLLNKPTYNNDVKMRILDKLSAYEAMKKVAEGCGLTADMNRGPDDSKQYWIQPSITDKQFIQNLWMGSNVGGSFTSVGITLDSKLLIRDMKKLCSQSPKWKFSFIGGGDAIVYEGDYLLTNRSGLLNHMGAYGKEKVLHGAENGGFTSMKPDVVGPFLCDGKLNRNSKVGRVYDSPQFQSKDTVHAKYHESKLINQTSLLAFSGLELVLIYSDRWDDLKIFDVAEFKDDKPTTQKKETSKYSAGKYILTRVTRSLSKKQHVTIVRMERESFSSQSGSFK